jgi:GNAT superfamily N-acetyltransferase
MATETAPTIRPATPDDAAGIAAVHVVSWQWAYRGKLPPEYLDSLDATRRVSMWERMITTDDSMTVLVAEQSGEIIGFCSVGPAKGDAGPETGELHAIYLLERVKGTGVGSALITGGIAVLRRTGYRDAVLWVLESNELAIEFYERAGWVHDGARLTYELRDNVKAPAVRYRLTL